MARSFLPRSWQTVVAVALAATAVAASACSSSNSETSPTRALFKHRPPPQGIAYGYHTVDHPNGSGNEVTGINNAQEIVGSYYPSGSGVNNSSYLATPNPSSPGTYGAFTDVTYPDAGKSTTSVTNTTYTWAISPGTTPSPSVEAGWAYDPGGFKNEVSGTVNNRGLWTVMHPDGEGVGHSGCQIMKLLGINDSHTAVGYYTPAGTSCGSSKTQAFEVFLGENHKDLNGFANDAASEATGINDENGSGSFTIVGWAQRPSSGGTFAWSELNGGKPTAMPSPSGAVSAIPYGINSSGLIVGEYTDASNNVHGFVYTPGSPGSYQTIDFQCTGCSNTVVYGINNSNDISGSYKDSAGQHGFVALPIPSPSPHRRRAVPSHSPGVRQAS
jgi:probable HAF family extracellular repeat protein